MARIGQMNFRGWIEKQRSTTSSGEQEDDHAYAYASDRHTRAVMERTVPIKLAVEAVIRVFKALEKNALLGRSIKVGPKQFPRVHDLVQSCALSIGIDVPTVYITNNPVMNAGTFGTNDDSFIIVNSGLVDHLDDDELTCALGHECGHIHNNHVVYLTTLHYLTRAVAAYVRFITLPALMSLKAWSRRAEITADRASMLCVRKPDVCLRTLTKVALGSKKLSDEVNIDAFVEQSEESREGVGRFSEAFSSHPWLAKRAAAMRVFERSRLYRVRAGLDNNGLSINEVDEQVHKIVKVL